MATRVTIKNINIYLPQTLIPRGGSGLWHGDFCSGTFRATFSSDCCIQSVNFLATISGSPLQEIDLLGNKLRESLLANRRRPCGLVSWAGCK